MKPNVFTNLSDGALDTFIAERGELDPNFVWAKGAFFSSYRDWAQEKGEFVLPSFKLSREMTARGFNEYRSKAVRCWKGIRLKEMNSGVEAVQAPPLQLFPVQRESTFAESKALQNEKIEGIEVDDVSPDENAVDALLRRRMMGLWDTTNI